MKTVQWLAALVKTVLYRFLRDCHTRSTGRHALICMQRPRPPVISSERLSAAPNVPTFVESGYPEMVADFKTAMFVPKGTPQPVIDKLNAAVKYALSDKALVDRYGQNGTMLGGSDPREPVQTFKRDRDMYGRLIERTGLKFD